MSVENKGRHPLGICDGCKRKLSDYSERVTVCTWHWHHLCENCARMLERNDVTPEDRPSHHHTADALKRAWIWCPMDMDSKPVPEPVLAMIALTRSA